MKKTNNNNDDNNITGKILVTIISALLCGYLMYNTGGENGLGWFIIALLIIW